MASEESHDPTDTTEEQEQKDSGAEGQETVTPATFTWREPIADGFDPTTETDVGYLEGKDGWRMLGVSIRGLSHQHRGSYREDAFSMRAWQNWCLVAVGDGAGSYPLSRLGAREATNAAVESMNASLINFPDTSPSTLPTDEMLRTLLLVGLSAADSAIRSLAREYARPMDDFSTTMLLVVHLHTTDGRQIVATAQIGDGEICAFIPGGAQEYICLELAAADFADYAGFTPLLHRIDDAQWPNRVRIIALPMETEAIMLVTDGIADDFIPVASNLWRLMRALRTGALMEPSPEQALEAIEQIIHYQRQGSFDDRTVLLIHRSLPLVGGV